MAKKAKVLSSEVGYNLAADVYDENENYLNSFEQGELIPLLGALDGKRVLDVSGAFFNGKIMNQDEAREEIIRCAKEDATFNFVGKDSVRLAKELELVLDGGVVEIDGVPFGLVLM